MWKFNDVDYWFIASIEFHQKMLGYLELRHC